jgi:F-type H+-transporting ATPase subunit epsilon
LRLKVFIPTQVLVDEEIKKIVAEDDKGLFCLLPRHCDYVANLVPSVASFVTKDGVEKFVATDTAVIIKKGSEVRISTARGFVSDSLEEITTLLQKEFTKVHESEDYKVAQTALAHLEIGIMRNLMALGEN